MRQAVAMVVAAGAVAAMSLAGCASPQTRLDYAAFDQTPGAGWRALCDAGRYCAAADLIDEYLRTRSDLAPWQRINLRFHAAQCRAIAGDTRAAIAGFEASINPDEPPTSAVRWNAYVRATLAFLRGDREELLRQREVIAGGSEIGGVRANLDVVDRLVEGFGRSYAEAYLGAGR